MLLNQVTVYPDGLLPGQPDSLSFAKFHTSTQRQEYRKSNHVTSFHYPEKVTLVKGHSFLLLLLKFVSLMFLIIFNLVSNTSLHFPYYKTEIEKAEVSLNMTPDLQMQLLLTDNCCAFIYLHTCLCHGRCAESFSFYINGIILNVSKGICTKIHTVNIGCQCRNS